MQSSMLSACEFDDETKELTVTFANGKDYVYEDVDMATYDNLINAMEAGLIQDFSIPNQYIIASWQADGQFHANSRFNPKNGPLK